MPTYEYECPKCGHLFERFQQMVDDPVKKCPQKGCNGKVRRLISSGSGLIFKGSGFHATDYKKPSGGEPAAPACPAAKSESCPAGGTCPAAAAAGSKE